MSRALILGCLVVVGASRNWAEEPSPKFKMTMAEEKLLELTNRERKKNDLPPLKPTPLLFQAARDHSANMAKQGKMEHELDGKNPFHRIKATGYQYRNAGENIAFGNVPVEEIMVGWMKSELHRKNILHKEFTEIGLGLARDKKGAIYYTQVFGRPRSD